MLQLTCILLGADTGCYPYMAALCQLSHPPSAHPPSPVRWPECSTPIRVRSLEYYLHNHPDQAFIRFILQGLSQGFHIGFTLQNGQVLQSSPPQSYLSMSENPLAITQYIAEECALGHVVGQLPGEVSQLVHCSPIGLVPKGRGTGQWRMIVNLSYPEGRSINDGIEP